MFHNGCGLQEMSDYQRSHYINQLPSLLEFFGYVFCFGNLLGGPFLEFKDYQTFIRLQGLWDPKAPKPIQASGAFKQVQGAASLRWGITWPVACQLELCSHHMLGGALHAR